MATRDIGGRAMAACTRPSPWPVMTYSMTLMPLRKAEVTRAPTKPISPGQSSTPCNWLSFKLRRSHRTSR